MASAEGKIVQNMEKLLKFDRDIYVILPPALVSILGMLGLSVLRVSSYGCLVCGYLGVFCFVATSSTAWKVRPGST